MITALSVHSKMQQFVRILCAKFHRGNFYQLTDTYYINIEHQTVIKLSKTFPYDESGLIS